jgi:hypothetical protein
MGGSVSAPAPDPALMEAQVQSLQSQTDIGRRTLANAEQMMPVQREQMQFGLDAGKKAYEQTQDDRKYALEKRGQYDTALDAVLSESEKFDEANRRQELMQQAQADISSQFSAAQEQQQRGLDRAGVAPGSGKALMLGQQGELAEAAARSRAGLMVSEAAKKEGLQLRGQNVALLSGAPAAAASLSPTGASLGAMGLDVANTGLAGMNAGLGEADKAVAAYGKSAGDQWNSANALYTKAQDTNAHSNAEITGSALGLAAMGGYKGYKNYTKTGNVLGNRFSGMFGSE